MLLVLSLHLLCQHLDYNLAAEEEGDKLWQLDCNLATEEAEDNLALLEGKLSAAEARWNSWGGLLFPGYSIWGQ